MPFDPIPSKPAYNLSESKADRLLFLADFLEGVPEEQTMMSGLWRERGCGSVGCAMGWACQVPELQSVGCNEDNCSGPFFGMYLAEDTYCFLMQGYAHEPKRPDGEPWKRDIIRHIRETAIKVREREQ